MNDRKTEEFVRYGQKKAKDHLAIELVDWEANKDFDGRVSACRLIKALALQKYLDPEDRIDPMQVVEWFLKLPRSLQHPFQHPYNVFYTSKGRSLRQAIRRGAN